MSRVLMIVMRGEPSRFEYLKHAYSSATVEVIVDRRVAERRNAHAAVVTDRREATRRHRDPTADLQTFGWALVRH